MTQRFETLDERVRETERAMANRTTSHDHEQVSILSHESASNVATNLQSAPAVIPSINVLKENSVIQKQVDDRLNDYQGSQAVAQTGKLRSQRGGNNNVPIKKLAPWPQNYILTGPTKGRPTYDQLNQTQWVTGCLKAAMDLPQPDRDFKLEYLICLMEDASDFSFESAKACHAVVLTTYELGKLE